MKLDLSYSSPKYERYNPPFYKEKSLLFMINIWNINNNNKIKLISTNNYYNLLNDKLKNKLGNNRYWLWCGYLYYLNKTTDKMKKRLKRIEKDELKPEKPESWVKNPKTWLSNYDIQNVLNQYQENNKYKYSLIGVFPIDFSVIASNGICAYNNICIIDVKQYIKKKKNFLGLITNLDKHNEPGSHWTSTFFVINPKLPSYGVYYYDSTSRGIPSYLLNFINNVKEQMDKLYPNNNFNIIYNKKQHQYKNTECGVFSIIFQLRWLNKHIIKHNNTSFKEIIEGSNDINDEQMILMRDYLFRPNTKTELKKLKLL